MNRKLLVVIAIAVMFVLGACSEKAYEPREINSETDICKVCNMSIVHEDYAGQIIFKNGDYEIFDDIGCLMEFMQDTEQSEIGAAFIKDAAEDEWIHVEEANYIYSKDYWTPMNYGVLAFSTEEAAKSWIASNGDGQSLAYDELFDFHWGIHVD